MPYFAFYPDYQGNAVPNPDKTIVNQRTVWNFHGFTSLDLNGLSWIGSILAPRAYLSFNSANVEGNLYVKKWISGNGQAHTVSCLRAYTPLLA